jgi:NADH-quinone oxidoreductase subunit C
VKLEKATPTIPSIAGIIKGANWIEREIAEMLGIEFQGHPRPERLLLGEQWPAGVHPLRRDYEEWDPEAIRDRGV